MKYKGLKRILAMSLTLALVFGTVGASGTVDNGAMRRGESTLEHPIVLIDDLFEDEEFAELLVEQMLEELGAEYVENLEQARDNKERLVELFDDCEFHALAEDNVFYATVSRQDAISVTVVCDEPNYPDFVGGIYFNDDGNMVLQIVEESALENIEQFYEVDSFVKSSDGIIVEFVQYSQNELNTTIDILNCLLLSDNRPTMFDYVDSFGEDTINNRVIVRLNDYSEEKISRFRNEIFDSSILLFAPSFGYLDTLTSTPPTITLSSGGTNFLRCPTTDIELGSIGYRARISRLFSANTYGFVTHGHDLQQGQQLRIGNHNYGEVRYQQFSGRLDAAFVQTNARVILTNPNTSSSAITVRSHGSLVVGDRVSKVGKSTGVTHGTITYRNQTVTVVNYRGTQTADITGQTLTNLHTRGGDSGGAVFWLGSANGSNQFQLAGIISSGEFVPGHGQVTSFVSAVRINSDFGIQTF